MIGTGVLLTTLVFANSLDFCGYPVSRSGDSCTDNAGCLHYTAKDPGDQFCYGPGQNVCRCGTFGVSQCQPMTAGRCDPFLHYCVDGFTGGDPYACVYVGCITAEPCGE
jgi:hypothetical protein